MDNWKGRQQGRKSVIIELEENHFPFGSHQLSNTHNFENRHIFVRKNILFRNQKQKQTIQAKLDLLKNASHRNLINIRNIQTLTDSCCVYYNYVHIALENAFQQIDHQTFKDLHKQVIQLAIHLAKNYVLTSFHPSRCGIVFVEGNPILKYYLPVNEVTLSWDISALERSVQLFKVQAMHLLDHLRHPDLFTDLNFTHSDTSIKIQHSPRQKNSQVIDLCKNRKLSNRSARQRKHSSYYEIMSEIKRKKSQDSTHYTEMRISGLKQTLKTIRTQSQRKRTHALSKEKIKIQVDLVKVRSARVLRLFQNFKKEIAEYIALARLLKLCKQV